MSHTVFQTENSALICHSLDEEWVKRMTRIAIEVDALLEVHPRLMMYGRECHMQRSVAFFSDESIGYRYSGQIARAQPLTSELSALLSYVNERFQATYNGILVNKYANGEEYISKHSDDEHALDPRNGVMAISVGAVRKFRVRSKETGAIVVDVPTEPATILNMCGDFQKEFTHEIPVEKRVDGVRYSFTFRHHTE